MFHLRHHCSANTQQRNQGRRWAAQRSPLALHALAKSGTTARHINSLLGIFEAGISEGRPGVPAAQQSKPGATRKGVGHVISDHLRGRPGRGQQDAQLYAGAVLTWQGFRRFIHASGWWRRRSWRRWAGCAGYAPHASDVGLPQAAQPGGFGCAIERGHAEVLLVTPGGVAGLRTAGKQASRQVNSTPVKEKLTPAL